MFLQLVGVQVIVKASVHMLSSSRNRQLKMAFSRSAGSVQLRFKALRVTSCWSVFPGIVQNPKYGNEKNGDGNSNTWQNFSNMAIGWFFTCIHIDVYYKSVLERLTFWHLYISGCVLWHHMTG